MKVLTSKEMKEVEKKAAQIGIAPIILMENAAIGILNVISDIYKDFNSIKAVVLAGRGNNGGDAFAVARHLFNRGVSVKVVAVYPDSSKKLTEEAYQNLKIVENMGIFVKKVNSIDEETKKIFSHSNLIIDGLLGTGVSRNLSGVYLDIVSLINSLGKDVLSIDIPSGVNADTGKVMGEAIKATITVALGFFKPGHFLFPGRDFSGKVFLSPISLPKSYYEEDLTSINKIEEHEVVRFLKHRQKNSHKGTYGHIVVIGGSPGKTGAVAMSGMASLRVGAGLSTIICPSSLNPIIEQSFLEVMTYPASDINGYISLQAFDSVCKFLDDKDVVVIGPGLSTTDITAEFFVSLMQDLSKPVVVDADGLNLVAKNIKVLENKKNPVILTPHPGEMARLTGLRVDDILQDPISVARQFSEKQDVYVVLKSATTVFATPKGEIYLSTYGNPGMATAGVGDVLSGIIGGFLAQGYEVEKAVMLALAVHGIAGDIAKNRGGEAALVATDILSCIAEVIKKLEVMV